MNNDDDNDVQTLADVLKCYKSLEWRFLTFWTTKKLHNVILMIYNVLNQINVTKRHFNNL